MHRITFQTIVDEKVDVLINGINHYVVKHYGLSPMKYFCFYVWDEHDQIKGGVYGYTNFGCLHIEILWVDESLRGQGYGEILLDKAEDFGREHECSFAELTTFDWHALKFYHKHGYFTEFRRFGHEKGQTQHFMRKHFIKDEEDQEQTD